MNDTVERPDGDRTPTFVTSAWYHRASQHWVAVTRLDRDTVDFAHLIGHEVLVDGHRYLCTGVERFAHTPPFRRGEPIGLALTPSDATPPPDRTGDR